MKGADYIATTRLTNRAGHVLAAVGETCERVDPNYLPVGLANGDIKPKGPAPKARRPEPEPVEGEE